MIDRVELSIQLIS